MKPGESAKQRTKEEKEIIYEAWKKSGLTKKEYCNQNGLKYQTFIWWFASERRKKKALENKFLPVQVELSQSGIFAEVILSSYRKIILHQPISVEIFQAILKC